MVNYPNKKKINNSHLTTTNSASKRGMSLEKDINDSNQFYLNADQAVIYKKPTPIQVVRVDYPARRAAKIVEAYYQTPSTTDYNGIYKGKYLDFEAKETASKTAFTFRNIHPHQIQHLQRVIRHGGIGFFIIRFKAYNETFLIHADIVCDAYLTQKRQSLSYQFIKDNSILIQEGFAPRLKYLQAVDELFFMED